MCYILPGPAVAGDRWPGTATRARRKVFVWHRSPPSVTYCLDRVLQVPAGPGPRDLVLGPADALAGHSLPAPAYLASLPSCQGNCVARKCRPRVSFRKRLRTLPSLSHRRFAHLTRPPKPTSEVFIGECVAPTSEHVTTCMQVSPPEPFTHGPSAIDHGEDDEPVPRSHPASNAGPAPFRPSLLASISTFLGVVPVID